MASLIKRGNARVLQFSLNGRRYTASLGAIGDLEAKQVKLNVERLVAAEQAGVAPDADLRQWMASVTGSLQATLVKAGWQCANVAQTLEEYLTGQPNGRRAVVAGELLALWGCGRRVSHLTPADGRAYYESLSGSRSTVLSKVTVARSLMSRAVENHWLAVNPFSGIVVTQKESQKRRRFVTQREVADILEACPDPEFRLIVCLGRYAGLRIPSELQHLKWSDVDWSRSRFVVTDVKRNVERVVPIFPELSAAFADAFAEAKDGQEYVIDRHRTSQLDRLLKRYAKRAGVAMWRKPWHSLRASRETELIEQHPIHVACAWIGNSPAVALKHYAMVRESDFAAAIAPSSTHSVPAAPSESPRVLC